MKKCLVVLTGILLLVLGTFTASASPILSGYTACGGVGGPTGSTAFVAGGPPTGSTVSGNSVVTGSTDTITCSLISSVPVGDYLTQIDLYLKDDASTPSSVTSSVIDSWASSTTGVVFNAQITTASSDGINFNECQGTGGSASGVCPIVLSFPQSNLTSFGNIVVTVSAVAGAGGGVATTGSDSANLYIQYEYSPVAPEPTTLGLMGGALLGLGLLAKKVRR